MYIQLFRLVILPLIFICIFTDLLEARGPRGRPVRRSSGSSSRSSSYHSSSSYSSSSGAIVYLSIPFEQRIKAEFIQKKAKCTTELSYLSDQCEMMAFESKIQCLTDLKGLLAVHLDSWQKLSDFNRKSEEEQIDAQIVILREKQIKSDQSIPAYLCRKQYVQYHLGFNVFMVDPKAYSPIQGKIEHADQKGYGFNFWFQTRGFKRLNAWSYLDFDFRYVYESIPLLSKSFGDRQDVTFDESLNWMMIDPLSISWLLALAPNHGESFFEKIYLRLDLGSSFVNTHLGQTMTSNYEGGSDQIGEINASVMSAWGFVAKGEAFIPFYGSTGLLFLYQYRSFFSPSFENGNLVLNKVTFDDLIKNNGYAWSTYGIKLATQATYFQFELGFQETQILGASGTDIKHQSLLFSLSGSFYGD
jgi:hypothetical protein